MPSDRACGPAALRRKHAPQQKPQSRLRLRPKATCKNEPALDITRKKPLSTEFRAVLDAAPYAMGVSTNSTSVFKECVAYRCLWGRSIEEIPDFACSNLPPKPKPQVKAVMRAAFRLPAREGVARLQELAEWLEREYPSAAAGQREGREVLTVGHSTETRNRNPQPEALCLVSKGVCLAEHSGRELRAAELVQGANIRVVVTVVSRVRVRLRARAPRKPQKSSITSAP